MMMIFRKILILILLTLSNNAYSKDGYKDVKFDMSFDELVKLVKKNDATFYQLSNFSPHIIVIEDLYKYELNVHFEEDTLEEYSYKDKGIKLIKVIVFNDKYTNRRYSNNSSNISKFDDLRRNLDSKYNFLAEPDELEIDKYNNRGYPIKFFYLSKSDPKIVIILELTNTFHEVYWSSVSYLHPEYTESTIEDFNEKSSMDDF